MTESFVTADQYRLDTFKFKKVRVLFIVMLWQEIYWKFRLRKIIDPFFVFLTNFHQMCVQYHKFPQIEFFLSALYFIIGVNCSSKRVYWVFPLCLLIFVRMFYSINLKSWFFSWKTLFIFWEVHSFSIDSCWFLLCFFMWL